MFVGVQKMPNIKKGRIFIIDLSPRGKISNFPGASTQVRNFYAGHSLGAGLSEPGRVRATHFLVRNFVIEGVACQLPSSLRRLQATPLLQTSLNYEHLVQ